MQCWFSNKTSEKCEIRKRLEVKAIVGPFNNSKDLGYFTSLLAIPPPPLPVIVQKDWDQDKELRNDAWMKNAVRSFRRWLKNLYKHYFDRKYYHWNESTIRKNTRIFFLELCKFGISKEFYN